MALPTSGTISHKMIMDEFGHSGQFAMSSQGAGFIGKTPGNIIKESDFYGKSNGPPDLGNGNDGRGCFFVTSGGSGSFYFSQDGKSWSKYEAASGSSVSMSSSSCSRYGGTNFLVNSAFGPLNALNGATPRSGAASGSSCHHNGPVVANSTTNRKYWNGTGWFDYNTGFSFFSPFGTCNPSPCTTPGQVRGGMTGYKKVFITATGPTSPWPYNYTPTITKYGGVTGGFTQGKAAGGVGGQYCYGKGNKFYVYSSGDDGGRVQHGGQTNDWVKEINKGSIVPTHIRRFNGAYYAVGNIKGSALAKSTNLIDWSTLTPPSGLNTSSDKALQISNDGTTLVIVQSGTKAWYSTNGTTWTEGTCAGGWPSAGATMYKHCGDA